MTVNGAAPILVVDDQRENLEALEALLAPLGKVVTAGSGEEALKQVLREDFAVILMDVRMPTMDGFETVELLKRRERNQHTAVIFLTGVEKDAPQVFRGYSAGAVDYISKPVDADVLRSKVAVLVDLHRKTVALERRAEDLARSNAELEQYAYVVSHDLQEPLRSIGGFAQLLALRYREKLDEDADQFIDFIVQGVGRLQALINDLLTYSRAGRAELRRERIDCNALVKRTLSSLGAALDDADAEVKVGRLPTIEADREKLGQVFQNLLSNALKFTDTRPPRVEVSATQARDGWTFAVADNGIGIEPVYAERIFRMYQRLHAQDEYDGTGMGLAICKQIVERHGGRIWCEPRRGGGAVFRFTVADSERTRA
jgi:two-component system, sensor histidine kinase and response regulator